MQGKQVKKVSKNIGRQEDTKKYQKMLKSKKKKKNQAPTRCLRIPFLFIFNRNIY